MLFQGARNEIFAMQPAPIQVSYMGFPATTGASYIDYLLTDEVCWSYFPYLIYMSIPFFDFMYINLNLLLWQFVSPLKYSHIYSEKLVHLPHCYFVNDYKQVCIVSFTLKTYLQLLWEFFCLKKRTGGACPYERENFLLFPLIYLLQ